MKYTFAICIAALSSICAGQGLGLDNLPDCAVRGLSILHLHDMIPEADRAPETVRFKASRQLRYQDRVHLCEPGLDHQYILLCRECLLRSRPKEYAVVPILWGKTY